MELDIRESNSDGTERILWYTGRTCPECYNTSIQHWRDLPMNETIREYACTYVSPVKMFYKDLDEAMRVWEEEDE